MKRLGRILKWTAIVAATVITALLTLNACFVWSSGTRLERRLAALRQAGDPVQLADLAHEPIPPEQNADVFLRRAADDLDAIQKELLTLYPKAAYPTGPVSSVEQDELDKLFGAYPKLMLLLEQAADCPDFDTQLDWTLAPSQTIAPFMSQTSRHRLLARVLRCRSAWLVAKGRNDDALATQILLLRLSRHWRGDPLLIGYLATAVCEQVAIESANEALRAGPVSPASRQALDAELARHDTMAGYVWALRSERAYALSSVREIPGTGFWLLRGFANDLMAKFIDLFDRLVENASRPHAVVVSEKAVSATLKGAPNLYGALVTLLEPALNSARIAAERTRAMSRSLRVLNVLQTRVPPGSDLVPKLTDLGLPAAATIDPFSGEPLHVKKLPEGWMVYSAGADLVDDGGNLNGKNDIGVGPTFAEASAKKR